MNNSEHTVRVGVTTNIETPLIFDTRSNASIETLRSERLIVFVSCTVCNESVSHQHTAGQIEQQHALVESYRRKYGQVTCSVVAVDYKGHTGRFALADTQLLSCKTFRAVICTYVRYRLCCRASHIVISHRRSAYVFCNGCCCQCKLYRLIV